MAVFHTKCANAEIRIHNRDHNPPHCHVRFGRDVRVRLDTLEVYKSTLELSAKIRECLRKHQAEILEAWKRVTIDPA